MWDHTGMSRLRRGLYNCVHWQGTRGPSMALDEIDIILKEHAQQVFRRSVSFVKMSFTSTTVGLHTSICVHAVAQRFEELGCAQHNT